MIKIMKYLVMIIGLITLCIISLFMFFAMAKPNITTLEIAKNGIIEIEKILISNNYCINQNDCTRKEFLFYEASFNTIYLHIYNNIDTKTISDIQNIINKLKKKNQNINFDLNFYEYQHYDYTDNNKNKKSKKAYKKIKRV